MKLSRLLFLALLLTAFASCAYSAVVMDGTIVNIHYENKLVTIKKDGVEQVVAVDDKTSLMRQQVGKEMEKVSISDIAPGDRAVAVVKQDGTASSLKAFYGLIKGTYVAYDKRKITLKDGREIKLHPYAQVLLSTGKTVAPGDIEPGSAVIFRVHPLTKDAWAVIAAKKEPTTVKEISPKQPVKTEECPKDAAGDKVTVKPVISSVTVSAAESIYPGDRITVDMMATAGGTASVRIKDLAGPLPMKEITPGRYRVVIDVPEDRVVTDAPVLAKLAVKDSESDPVQASRLITVSSPEGVAPMPVLANDTDKSAVVLPVPDNADSSVCPPSTDTGPVSDPEPIAVNDTQPVLSSPAPVVPTKESTIVVHSPEDGARLTESIHVKGVARPDSRVQVDITYTNGEYGLLELSGLVSSQVLATSGEGYFAAGPFPIAGKYATPGLEFTIKAWYPDRENHESVQLTVYGLKK